MKILMYFVDALPGNRVTMMEKSLKFKEFNKFVASYGERGTRGLQFSNVFTGTPDTPRSLSALFFGKEAIETELASRASWPGYATDLEFSSVFKKLQNFEFEVSFYLSKREITSKRFVPQECIAEARIYDSSRHRLSEHNFIAKNSLVFFQNNDYHFEIDDRHGHKSAFKVGLARVLNHVNTEVNFELYDFVIFFSDHGSVLSDSLKSDWSLTEDRIRCFLYLWSKQGFNRTQEESFLSIIDLHQILLNIAKGKQAISSSIIASREKQGIVFEDYDSFYPSINANHDEWGYLRHGMLHRISVKNPQFNSSIIDVSAYRKENKKKNQERYSTLHQQLDDAVKILNLRSKSFFEFYKRLLQEKQMTFGDSSSDFYYLNGEKRLRGNLSKRYFQLKSRFKR